MFSIPTLSDLPIEAKYDNIFKPCTAISPSAKPKSLLPSEKQDELFKSIILSTGIVGDSIEQYNEWLYYRLPQEIAHDPIILGTFDPINPQAPQYQNRRYNPSILRKLSFLPNNGPFLTFEAPHVKNTNTLLYPAMAYDLKANYTSRVYGKVVVQDVMRDVNDPNFIVTDEKGFPIFLEPYKEGQVLDNVHLFTISAMVRSAICNLHNLSDDERIKVGTCPLDPGGYYIRNGVDWTVITTEIIAQNKPVLTLDQHRKTTGMNQILRIISKTPYISYLTIIRRNEKSIIELVLNSFSYNAGLTVKEKSQFMQGLNLFAAFMFISPYIQIRDYRDHILSFINPQYKAHLSNILAITENAYLNEFGRYGGDDLRNQLTEKLTKIRSNTYDGKRQNKDSFIQEKLKDINDFANEPVEIRYQILHNEFMENLFPQNTTPLGKIHMLSFTVARYLELLGGFRQLDNRDSWENKKMATLTFQTEKVVYGSWKVQLNAFAAELAGKNIADKSAADLLKMGNFKKNVPDVLERHFTSSIFNANSWASTARSSSKGENLAQMLSRDNLVDTIAHLSRTWASGSGMGKSMQPRNVQASQVCFIDLDETPESDQLGLVKHRTTLCRFSGYIPPQEIYQMIIEMLSGGISTSEGSVEVSTIPETSNVSQASQTSQINPSSTRKTYLPLSDERKPRTHPDAIIIEGMFIGFHNGPELYELIRSKIRTIPRMKYLGLVYVPNERVLHILIDMGRPAAPFLIVNPETRNLVIDEKDLWKAGLNELIRQGALEYLGPWELSFKFVATSIEQLKERKEGLKKMEDELIVLRQKMDYALIRERGDGSGMGAASLGVDSLNNNEIIPSEAISDEAISNETLPDESTLNTYADYETLKTEFLRLQAYYKKQIFFTHAIVHPLGLVSPTISLIPYGNFNQGPRRTLAGKHTRQSIGLRSSIISGGNSLMRVSQSSTVPIVQTLPYKIYGLDKIPGGENMIIAIMTYGGANMEDGIIVNRAYLERGGMMSTVYETVTIKATGTASDVKGQSTKFETPIKDKNKPLQVYANLDEDGIIKINSRVREGDCLAGIIKTNIKGNQVERKDASYYAKKNEIGIVDNIVRNYNLESKIGTVTIRLRYTATSQVGDKTADRHAQKTTITKILDPADMPYFADGSSPAMLFSPFAIPSRMTMGKLWETIAGIYGIYMGETINASAFGEYDFDKMMLTLSLFGVNSKGNRKMFNPITGAEMECEIFAGPNYQQVLHHLVRLKEQVANASSFNAVNREATTGLRFGEMESQATASSGASRLRWWIMTMQSNPMSQVTCLKCGQAAIAGDVHNVYKCHLCGNVNPEGFGLSTYSASVDIMRLTMSGVGIKMALKYGDVLNV